MIDRMLLRPSEVADLLGLGRSKTYQLLHCGELRTIRIGKSLRVRSEDLEKWLDQVAAEQEARQ